MRPCLLVGICGRTGSGKTTMAQRIKKLLPGLSIGVFSMDDFYRDLSDEQHLEALANQYNFDCLEAFDLDALTRLLESVKKKEPFFFQEYDHTSHTHTLDPITCGPYDITIVEGLYLFASESIRKCFDISVFIDIDADESLSRRIRRDVNKRRKTPQGVLNQYERFVKPGYDSLVGPSKAHADIIVPGGSQNDAAIELITTYLQKQFQD